MQKHFILTCFIFCFVGSVYAMKSQKDNEKNVDGFIMKMLLSHPSLTSFTDGWAQSLDEKRKECGMESCTAEDDKRLIEEKLVEYAPALFEASGSFDKFALLGHKICLDILGETPNLDEDQKWAINNCKEKLLMNENSKEKKS